MNRKRLGQGFGAPSSAAIRPLRSVTEDDVVGTRRCPDTADVSALDQAEFASFPASSGQAGAVGDCEVGTPASNDPAIVSPIPGLALPRASRKAARDYRPMPSITARASRPNRADSSSPSSS